MLLTNVTPIQFFDINLLKKIILKNRGYPLA